MISTFGISVLRNVQTLGEFVLVALLPELDVRQVALNGFTAPASAIVYRRDTILVLILLVLEDQIFMMMTDDLVSKK